MPYNTPVKQNQLPNLISCEQSTFLHGSKNRTTPSPNIAARIHGEHCTLLEEATAGCISAYAVKKAAIRLCYVTATPTCGRSTAHDSTRFPPNTNTSEKSRSHKALSLHIYVHLHPGSLSYNTLLVPYDRREIDDVYCPEVIEYMHQWLTAETSTAPKPQKVSTGSYHGVVWEP